MASYDQVAEDNTSEDNIDEEGHGPPEDAPPLEGDSPRHAHPSIPDLETLEFSPRHVPADDAETSVEVEGKSSTKLSL